MSAFPLFDLLMKQVPTLPNSLTPEQKKRLTDNIKGLDQEGKDHLYQLIRYCSITLEPKDTDSVYEAKFQRKKVVFDLDLFPDTVQKLVWFFVDRHKKEMEATNAPVEIVFE